jgi:hypothetical protein
MNLGQSSNAGQFLLGAVTSDEHLSPRMLGGGDMHKIPSAGMGNSSMAGTQFIAPLEEQILIGGGVAAPPIPGSGPARWA